MTSTQPSLKTLAARHVKALAKCAAAAPLKPTVRRPSMGPGGNSGVARIPSLVQNTKIPTLSTKPIPAAPRLGASTERRVLQTAQSLKPQPQQRAPVPAQPQAPATPAGPLEVPVMSKTGFLGHWAARSQGPSGAEALTPSYVRGDAPWYALAKGVEECLGEDGRGSVKLGSGNGANETALVYPKQAGTSALFKQGFEQRLTANALAPRMLRQWHGMGLRGTRLVDAIKTAAAQYPELGAEFLKLADNDPLKMDPTESPLKTDSPTASNSDTTPKPAPPAPATPKVLAPTQPTPAPAPQPADQVPAGSTKPAPAAPAVETKPTPAPAIGGFKATSGPNGKTVYTPVPAGPRTVYFPVPDSYGRTRMVATYEDPTTGAATKPLADANQALMAGTEKGQGPWRPTIRVGTPQTSDQMAALQKQYPNAEITAPTVEEYADQQARLKAEQARLKAEAQLRLVEQHAPGMDEYTKSVVDWHARAKAYDQVLAEAKALEDPRSFGQRIHAQGNTPGDVAKNWSNAIYRNTLGIFSADTEPKLFDTVYREQELDPDGLRKDQRAYVEAKGYAGGRPAMPQPPKAVVVPGVTGTIDPSRRGNEYRTGEAFSPEQHKEFTAYVAQAKAEGRLKPLTPDATTLTPEDREQIEAQAVRGKPQEWYRLPEELGGGVIAFEPPDPHARVDPNAALAQHVLRRYAEGYGWRDTKNYGAVDAVRPAVSPFELLLPGAGLQTLVRGAGSRTLAFSRARARPARGTPGNPYSLDEAVAAAAKPLTGVQRVRNTAAGLLDPLGAVSNNLYWLGQQSGTLPFLARWAERLSRPFVGVPRYMSGAAGASNFLRGNARGGWMGMIAPLVASGATGSKANEAMSAPFLYPGLVLGMADDALAGNFEAAVRPYTKPLKDLTTHTIQPLDRVIGNAVQNSENWYDPIWKPTEFVGSTLLSGGKGWRKSLDALRQDTTLGAMKALEKGFNDPEYLKELQDLRDGINPGNPNNQNRLSDLLPAIPDWVPVVGGLGYGGQAPQEVRTQRAADALAKIDAKLNAKLNGGKPSGPVEPAPLTDAEFGQFQNDYLRASVSGDPKQAEAVFNSALKRVGNDATKLPMDMLAPPLSHESFPGMTPQQFGQMVDGGLEAGTFQKYTATRDELVALDQQRQAMLAAGKQPDQALETQISEKSKAFQEMHKRVQGRALAHYEATVMKDIREKEEPALEAEWNRLRNAMNASPRLSPQDRAALADLQQRGQDVSKKSLDFVTQRAAVQGGFKTDGTPIRTVGDFLGEMSKMKPVLGPDGSPVIGADGRPVMEPATRSGQELKTRIDHQLLAQIGGVETGEVDAQGRPVLHHIVPPGVGASVMERMDPTEKMLTYAGLGLGLVGILGSMFGFGGAWMPILGLLGGGFGLYKATGGDFGKVMSKDFWSGLFGGSSDAGKGTEEVIGSFADSGAMGLVSLDNLKQVPQYQDLVAGKMPASRAVQYMAALQPHDRARLAAEIKATQPQSPLLRMIGQVDQFEASKRQQQAAQAAVAKARAAVTPDQMSKATDLKSFWKEQKVPVGADGMPDLAAVPNERRAALVALMPPAVRQQAVNELNRVVNDKTMGRGWPVLNQIDKKGTKPGFPLPSEATPQEKEMARQALQMKDLLGG